jgi:hypothetical protein
MLQNFHGRDLLQKSINRAKITGKTYASGKNIQDG